MSKEVEEIFKQGWFVSSNGRTYRIVKSDGACNQPSGKRCAGCEVCWLKNGEKVECVSGNDYYAFEEIDPKEIITQFLVAKTKDGFWSASGEFRDMNIFQAFRSPEEAMEGINRFFEGFDVKVEILYKE